MRVLDDQLCVSVGSAVAGIFSNNLLTLTQRDVTHKFCALSSQPGKLQR